MALPPNLPFEQAAQIMRSRLMQYAKEVRERGFPSAAEAMTDAAVLISNVVECHAGLVEREERLTAELVLLQK